MGRKPVLRPIQLLTPSLSSPLFPPSTPTPTAALTPSPVPSPVPILQRRQPLILRENGVVRVRGKQRCAEMAGGTAAGCAAVCCCCPCGLVSLLVLTMVKLPAGLCRKAMRRRRRRISSSSKKIISNDVLLGKKNVGDEEEDEDVVVVRGGKGSAAATVWPSETSPSEEMLKVEKEMLDRFHGAGFWRSPSQREL